jgi:hypothetical protein
MTQATEEAYTVMQRVMSYFVATPSCGLLLAPGMVVKMIKPTQVTMIHSVMGRATFLNYCLIQDETVELSRTSKMCCQKVLRPSVRP